MTQRWLAAWLGDRSQLRAERLWLLLSLIWITGITLAPFDLSVTPDELPQRLQEVLRVGDSLDLLKLAAHFLSFLGLGVIAHANLPNNRRFGALFALGFGGCLALETAQLFQAGRHARIIDLAVNAGAFACGLWISSRRTTGEALREKMQTPKSRWPIAYVVVLAGACIAWWIIGLQPAFGALRMNWDPTFPLTIGNEIGGARPWIGQLRYVGIYKHALSGSEVGELFDRLQPPDNSEARRQYGLLVGYDFLKSTSAGFQSQGELKSDEWTLIVPPHLVWSASDGLTTASGAVVKTRGSGSQLADRIVTSGAFSIEAWARPGSLTQVGPARLVSDSSGPAARNFMLGQSGADLVFRVRNQANSANGNIYELTAPNLMDTGLQHIVATYDHGVSTIFKDAKRRAVIDLREPIFYCGLSTGPMARAALVFLTVMTISLPALFVFRRFFPMGRARAAALAFTAAIGVSPYLISCWIVGGPFRFGFVLIYIVAVLVLFPLGVRFVSVSRDIPA